MVKRIHIEGPLVLSRVPLNQEGLSVTAEGQMSNTYVKFPHCSRLDRDLGYGNLSSELEGS